MRNKIISLLLAAVMMLSMSVTVFAAPEDSAPEGFETVAQNKNFVLYADKKTGEIAVKVNSNGYIWYSNPLDSENDNIAGGELKKRIDSQLVLYYTQGWSEVVTNSVTGCVNRKGLKSEKIDNGIKFSYQFIDAGFTVPVQYKLEEDGLRAEVLLQEITPDVVTRQESVNGSKEKIDVDYNITKIDFMQYFGAGGAGEDGYMFVPEGSGGIINFNNGKVNYISYQAPIYGQYMDQATMRDLSNSKVRMPVYGMVKGNNGFVTIIEENESLGIVNSVISGRDTTYNVVYPTIYHKVIDFSAGTSRTQPLSEALTSKGNFSMKYHFLTGDKANYSGMAEVYRDYLVKEQNLTKTEKADSNPLYLEVFSGVERKTSIFGIVKKVFTPLATYEDVKSMAESYIDSGVKNLVIKYNGWTKNSERKKMKIKPTYEKVLGGKRAFKDMMSYAASSGVEIYPSINFVEYSKSRNGFSNVFDAAKSPDQSPAYLRPTLMEEGMYGQRWSMLKPDKVTEASTKFADAYKNSGMNNISLDYIGEKLYSDNTKGGVKRSDTVDVWKDVFADYKDRIGSVLVENANAYAFPYVDYIMDAPINEFGNEMIDEQVPFYQMVIHGLIPYSSPSINLAGDWKKTVLRAVETGSGLNFTLIKQNQDILMETYLNELYSCDFDTWFEKTVEEYKKADAVLSKTSGKQMTGHEKIADGVYLTVYEGNVGTVVNYNDEAVSTKYGMVGAEDYILADMTGTAQTTGGDTSEKE